MGKVFSSIIGTCNCSNLNDDISKEELTKIRIDISTITENHLTHIEKNIKDIEKDIAEVKTDIKIINNNLQILLSRL